MPREKIHAAQPAVARRVTGKGEPQGLAAAECANNGDSSTALIPATTPGVPGNAVPPVLLTTMLVPMTFIGAHAIQNSIFDTWMCLAFGLAGFARKRRECRGAIIRPLTTFPLTAITENDPMTHSDRTARVLSPVVTPFDGALKPDAARLARHCRWLVSNEVGLAVFGTNSEANSLSTGEKIELLGSLVNAGLPAERMMPGTGCCAIPDSVELTRAAVELGCMGVLMLPPFYYKNVSDEGLYRNYAEIIERVGDSRLRIYLYHIPPVAQVPITLTLIERLLKDFPGTIAGIKDSSGDWDNTRAMLEQFQPHGFDVYAGSETFLLDTVRNGGAGCISATANVNPAAISRLAKTWRDADADQQQSALNAVRGVFEGYVMIPGLKAAIAHFGGDEDWIRVRPPLVSLTGAQRAKLIEGLTGRGFTMPGLEAA